MQTDQNTDQRYASEIKKRLDAFKSAKQWSDFISLLSSLDSTLKKYNYSYIPHKNQLFKRLSQCLNPALPSGVHNKVLQTYHIIFSQLEKAEFIKNFNLYTLGLFSFSMHTRLILKLQYLQLIETHILPLAPHLAPFITNILIGILPNLDEENTDHFFKGISCIKALHSHTHPHTFYSSLFSLLHSCTHLRLPITNYLLKYNQHTIYTIQAIKAFSHSLKDKETFVLRSVLDILIMKYNLKQMSDSMLERDSMLESDTNSITYNNSTIELQALREKERKEILDVSFKEESNTNDRNNRDINDTTDTNILINNPNPSINPTPNLTTNPTPNPYLIELSENILKLFLRRDISLTKRVYSFYEISDSINLISLDIICLSLCELLKKNEFISFFKIMICLSDKKEVCDNVLVRITPYYLHRIYIVNNSENRCKEYYTNTLTTNPNANTLTTNPNTNTLTTNPNANTLTTNPNANTLTTNPNTNTLTTITDPDVVKYVNLFHDTVEVTIIWRIMVVSFMRSLGVEGVNDKDMLYKDRDMSVSNSDITIDTSNPDPSINTNPNPSYNPSINTNPNPSINTNSNPNITYTPHFKSLNLSVSDFIYILSFFIKNFEFCDKEVLEIHILSVFYLCLRYKKYFENEVLCGFLLLCIKNMEVSNSGSGVVDRWDTSKWDVDTKDVSRDNSDIMCDIDSFILQYYCEGVSSTTLNNLYKVYIGCFLLILGLFKDKKNFHFYNLILVKYLKKMENSVLVVSSGEGSEKGKYDTNKYDNNYPTNKISNHTNALPLSKVYSLVPLTFLQSYYKIIMDGGVNEMEHSLKLFKNYKLENFYALEFFLKLWDNFCFRSVYLIYEFNVLFGGKFERYVVLKLNGVSNEELVCLSSGKDRYLDEFSNKGSDKYRGKDKDTGTPTGKLSNTPTGKLSNTPIEQPIEQPTDTSTKQPTDTSTKQPTDTSTKQYTKQSIEYTDVLCINKMDKCDVYKTSNILLFIVNVLRSEEFYFIDSFINLNKKLRVEDERGRKECLGVFIGCLGRMKYFVGIYRNLLCRLKCANIECKDGYYVDVPEVEMIFSVFDCFLNLFEFSRNFREFCRTSNYLQTFDFMLFLNNGVVNARKILFSTFLYFVLNKIRVDGYLEEMRILRLKSLLLITKMLDLNILEPHELISFDLNVFIDFLEENKNDSLVIYGCLPFLRVLTSSSQWVGIYFKRICDFFVFHFPKNLSFFIFEISKKELRNSVVLNILDLFFYEMDVQIVHEYVSFVLENKECFGDVLESVVCKSLKYVEDRIRKGIRNFDILLGGNDMRKGGERSGNKESKVRGEDVNSGLKARGGDGNKELLQGKNTKNTRTKDEIVISRNLFPHNDLLYDEYSTSYLFTQLRIQEKSNFSFINSLNQELTNTEFKRCVDLNVEPFILLLDFVYLKENVLFAKSLLTLNPDSIILQLNSQKLNLYMIYLEKFNKNIEIYSFLSKIEESFTEERLLVILEQSSNILNLLFLQKTKNGNIKHYIWFLNLISKIDANKITDRTMEIVIRILENSFTTFLRTLDQPSKKKENKDICSLIKVVRNTLENVNTEKYSLMFNNVVYGLLKQRNYLYSDSLAILGLLKNWKKDFFELFCDQKFFMDSFENILIKKNLVSSFFSSEYEKIGELYNRMEQGFFVSKETDSMNKCNIIKRIAFLVFCLDKKIIYSKFPSIIEIISEFITNTSSILKKEIIFLIKIIFIKIDNEKLSHLWPLIFCEIFNEKEDLEVECETVRLIDIIFTFNAEETVEMLSDFIGGTVVVNDSELNSSFVHYLSLNCGDSQSQCEIKFEDKIVPLCKFINIKSKSDLKWFYENCNRYFTAARIVGTEVDYEFIEENVLYEFIEE